MGSISPPPVIESHGYNHAFSNFAQGKPDKTIDIGCNGVALSLDAQGRMLQLSIYHPHYGIVVATPFKQFDGTRFPDVPYVRESRTQMLNCLHDGRPGFGLGVDVQDYPVSINVVATNTVIYSFQLPSIVELVIGVHVHGNGTIEQFATATNNGESAVMLPYGHNLSVSLNRASYAQLTEGGIIPLPRSHNILKRMDPSTVQVSNPELGAQLLANLSIDDKPIEFGTLLDQETRDAPLHACVNTLACVQSRSARTICATFHFLPHLRQGHTLPQRQSTTLSKLLSSISCQWRLDKLLTTYIIKRNFEYVLGNCIVPVSDSAVAIIPDHVALPLGWNRDNYWQVRLLFETNANIDNLIHPNHVVHYQEQIKRVVRGHLHWVFLVAQRPHGFYHRSYLVNGWPKDSPIFQLDQQCYPLLELCDYLEYFPHETDFIKELIAAGTVQAILELLIARRDPITCLWQTDETPADDPLTYKYHFSSHVLLWHTLNCVRRLFSKMNVDARDLSQELQHLADDLKSRTLRAFRAKDGTGRHIFAYCTDGQGHYKLYHDANDVPTLFAPEWGFVTTLEEIATWRHTMAFGLSNANVEGYCDIEPYGGLGSIHSPGAWTLGYYQELAYAAWAEDSQAMQRAWKKVTAAMQWDGTFSEAVDPRTARCTSKAWFSWPGAMIGVLLIKLRGSKQEKILLTTDTSGK